MVVALLGNPLAGKHTLATVLAPLVSRRIVTFDDLAGAIERGDTVRASVARKRMVVGELLPDELVGQLLAEAVAGDEVIIVGRPRNLGEMESFIRTSGQVLSVLHLEAGRELIDARMKARGLRPVEVEHPGALLRLRQALQPVLDRAQDSRRLLTLDAALPTLELAERARAFIEDQLQDAG